LLLLLLLLLLLKYKLGITTGVFINIVTDVKLSGRKRENFKAGVNKEGKKAGDI
jgi:hypothetical protein